MTIAALPADRAPPNSASTERSMIGVVVTFRYGDNFDEQGLRKIAETARARFEGMP